MWVESPINEGLYQEDARVAITAGPTLEATQGQIVSQSPTDATSGR